MRDAAHRVISDESKPAGAAKGVPAIRANDGISPITSPGFMWSQTQMKCISNVLVRGRGITQSVFTRVKTIGADNELLHAVSTSPPSTINREM